MYFLILKLLKVKVSVHETRAKKVLMLGILDFEKKLAEISDTELLPHLSLELSRIPWSEERDHLIPKFSRDQIKFKYKDDFISDFLIKQQERAQDVTSRFSVQSD